MPIDPRECTTRDLFAPSHSRAMRGVYPQPFPCAMPHPNVQIGQPYPDSNQAPPLDTEAQRNYLRYTIVGNVPLVTEVGGTLPPSFRPLAQTPTGEGDTFLTCVVVQFTVEQGYIMLAADVVGNLDEPAWSDLVEWAIYINGKPTGRGWTGNLWEPYRVPFTAHYYENTTIQLCARISPAGWWTGATPVTDYLTAYGELRVVMITANAYGPAAKECAEYAVQPYRMEG